ncbi:beta-amyrin 11-oxidase-like [Tasmannia lanceolata]|uniref:beta-amyrin 11-oxidase-like n=1 Tax=Tasmannia lanceolata TaxID=3420 RepID=UPI004064B9DE
MALGILPLVVWLFWSWNELWFLAPIKASLNGAKLPPGHMGLPFIGEMLSFLWYFKIVCRPDDFINSRKQRYGDGVGMYRSHLYGSPSIIACSHMTFENICGMFVGLEQGPLLQEVGKWFTGMTAGFRAQPFNFPGTAYHHALQCRRKLGAVFRAELVKRKQRGDVASEERNDLMDGLMQIKDEEGKQLGDEEVVDNIVPLIVGSYEPTSVATTWCLYYLAKSPSVLRRLREEHMKICEQKKGAFITVEDIRKMKYTHKVIDETVRMANVAPMIFRQVNKDVDYQGYRIPKDWKVVVWLRQLHTDPNNFEDPFNFNPDLME